MPGTESNMHQNRATDPLPYLYMCMWPAIDRQYFETEIYLHTVTARHLREA